ncbi:hypothetical protein BH09BAC4_BH09BAC4_14020 [soil metagenome]
MALASSGPNTLLRLHDQQPDTLIQHSRDDLAAITGTAMESLISTLNGFKLDGLIEITPSGGIRMLHPEKLGRTNW